MYHFLIQIIGYGFEYAVKVSGTLLGHFNNSYDFLSNVIITNIKSIVAQQSCDKYIKHIHLLSVGSHPVHEAMIH